MWEMPGCNNRGQRRQGFILGISVTGACVKGQDENVFDGC